MAIRGIVYYTVNGNASPVKGPYDTYMTAHLDPISDDMKSPAGAGNQAAIELIRQKVAAALGEEPQATAEMAVASKLPLSKHQQFMQELSQSGKSLAEIQTEWHRYYTMLPDAEKNAVWQEFYAANQHTPYQKLFEKKPEQALQPAPAPTPPPHQPPTVSSHQTVPKVVPFSKLQSVQRPVEEKTGDKIKKRIVSTVTADGKLEAKHHWQSLLFGLGMGAIVLVVVMFSFFNEYVIAPFIQPSRKVTSVPIIVGDTTVNNATPTVMVPKINIQIPIDFSVPSIDEATIQASLNGGVVHYPSTAVPGQNGNGAYFGHSSQNIFNNGKYKFAFVLLHQVTTGDIFYITYQGKRYVYQVFAKEIVPPTQVSVLNDTKGRQATAVLITCDPPGFSTNRLVVWGEQISPSPVTNIAAATPNQAAQPTEIAGKGESAWSRFINILEFWKQDN